MRGYDDDDDDAPVYPFSSTNVMAKMIRDDLFPFDQRWLRSSWSSVSSVQHVLPPPAKSEFWCCSRNALFVCVCVCFCGDTAPMPAFPLPPPPCCTVVYSRRGCRFRFLSLGGGETIKSRLSCFAIIDYKSKDKRERGVSVYAGNVQGRCANAVGR